MKEDVPGGETGLLVETDNLPALGAALARVLPNPDLQECFTAAGWERARAHFSIEVMAARYLALYREILAR